MYQDNREVKGNVEETRMKLEDRHPIVDLVTKLKENQVGIANKLDQL